MKLIEELKARGLIEALKDPGIEEALEKPMKMLERRKVGLYPYGLCK